MRKDIVLVALIVASLALMVIPLDPLVIDVLLAVNMTFAVTLLMVAVYLKHPSDFSTFPSVILIGTAFRLALSIGTTRLILTEAEAGEIITTFGNFVVAGSIAVGIVIFLIITVVQFIVVTKGAERVAEVGARFALDALPGKQMTIDAEARAGNLTPEQAAEKRRRLDQDSRFFGAMDGAMKFVKGDAIAGIIIIFINLLGGIAVGVTSHGYSLSEAISIFSLLTVGDGLVAQIPALLMSLCAGIIVTRAEGQEGEDLGSDISAEIIADPRVPGIGAPIVFGIGLIPGFPTLIFAAMAVGLMAISFAVRRQLNSAKAEEADLRLAADAEAASEEEVGLPVSDRVCLKFSADLGETLDLAEIDRKIAEYLAALYAARGVRFPRPEIVANAAVGASGLSIDIDEVPVHRETIPDDHFLILGHDASQIEAIVDTEITHRWTPIGGIWLPEATRELMTSHGIDAVTLEEGVAGVGYRIYEQNLGQLFSHSVFSQLMDEARAAEPDLMEKIEKEIDDGALHKVFRYLVEDGVPLRPLSLVVSSIRYWLTTLDDVTPVILAECLRGSLKRQLCHRIAGPERLLGIALLGPRLERDLRRSMSEAGAVDRDGALDGLSLRPELNDRLLTAARRLANRPGGAGRRVALVAAADIRRRLRNHLAANGIQLQVLAPHEIANEVPTFPLDLVEPDARPNRDLNGAGEKAKEPETTSEATSEPALGSA